MRIENEGVANKEMLGKWNSRGQEEENWEMNDEWNENLDEHIIKRM